MERVVPTHPNPTGNQVQPAGNLPAQPNQQAPQPTRMQAVFDSCRYWAVRMPPPVRDPVFVTLVSGACIGTAKFAWDTGDYQSAGFMTGALLGLAGAHVFCLVFGQPAAG